MEREEGGKLNFREKMMLVGTGGPGALQTSSDERKAIPERKIPPPAVRGRDAGGYADCRGKMEGVGAGGLDALQTSSDGGKAIPERKIPIPAVRGRDVGEICKLPRQDGRCGSWGAGRPPDHPAREKAEVG